VAASPRLDAAFAHAAPASPSGAVVVLVDRGG
jgi:hypothetical protein